MARRGALEDRLRGILDSRRSRAALTTAAVCLGAALAAAAIAPLAMLRAAPPKPPQTSSRRPKAGDPPKRKARDARTTNLPSAILRPRKLRPGRLASASAC